MAQPLYLARLGMHGPVGAWAGMCMDCRMHEFEPPGKHYMLPMQYNAMQSLGLQLGCDAANNNTYALL